MLLALLTLLLLTEGMQSELLATLSPPHHLPSPFSSVAPTAPGIPSPGGLTILVCVISNVLHAGDLEVAWISTRSRSGSGSEGAALPASYSLIRGQDGSHSAMAVISVASSEWQSYMCFVSHRGVSTSAVTQSQYVVGFPNTTTDSEPDQLDQCEEDESSTFNIYAGIKAQTNHVVVLALRHVLLKITIFNVLMTARAVIIWMKADEDRPVNFDETF